MINTVKDSFTYNNKKDKYIIFWKILLTYSLFLIDTLI